MVFFFVNDTATPEIYTLSLHDALPIWLRPAGARVGALLRHPRHDLQLLQQLRALPARGEVHPAADHQDRKSTRLNSSHANISYAVFCLKKKISHLSYSCSHTSPNQPPH